MLLQYDTSRRVLEFVAEGPGDEAALSVSHGETVNIQLFAKHAAATLGTGQALKLELVKNGQYDTDAVLASVTLTSSDLNGSVANQYDGELDTLNSAVATLLAIDGDKTNDVDFVECNLFVGYRASAGVDFLTCIDPLPVKLRNTPFAATQTTPFPLPNGLFLPFRATALTGNTATTLDGIATTTLTADSTMLAVLFNGALNFWQLQTKATQTVDGVGVVQPADYNVSTNAKYWVIIA